MSLRKKIIIAIILIVAAFTVKLVPVPEPDPPIPIPAPIIPAPDIVEPVLELREVKVVKTTVNEKSLYSDVINRSANPYLSNGVGRSTQAHETAHMIHSELRNAEVRKGVVKPQAFFVAPDKAFFTRGAKFRKSEIAPFIPENLRYSRFKVYVSGAHAWDDTPLYLFDEWTAYIIGAMVGLDDEKNGIPRSKQVDTVMGSLEFSIYAVATAMAIKEKDPELWNDVQFRLFVKTNLKIAEKVFMEGRPIFRFAPQDTLLSELRESDSATDMRNFINAYFDGVFLQ